MLNSIKKNYSLLIFYLLISSVFSSKCYNFIEILNDFNRANRDVLYTGFISLFSPIINNKTQNSNILKNLRNNVNEDLIDLIDSDSNKAKAPNKKNFTFKDLAGYIPEDVKEIVDFLKNPERFEKVGAEMPKGILLVGPPGTGKTSIARAIAGEVEAEFFSASATDFVEIYVGQGAKRIRDLFTKAHKVIEENANKKVIIFIDELDAIGGARKVDENLEYRSTLNELLNQMDGFKQHHSILILGATNTPDSIDSALKRPGRFDRIVEIALPDKESRKRILTLYCNKIKCDNTVNIEKITDSTNGFSGAELKNLVNEAAVRAARLNIDHVTMEHFEMALQDLKNKHKYSK